MIRMLERIWLPTSAVMRSEYFEDSGINCRISIPDNLPDIEVIGEIRGEMCSWW